MKAKVSLLLKSLLGSVLAFLGFNSCDVVPGGMMCMYGQPHADFTIKGTVTDEEGKPIEGIKAVVDVYENWTDGAGIHRSQLDYTDTIYTDSQGKIRRSTSIFDKAEVNITLSDVDGAENGSEFEGWSIEGLEMKEVKEGDDSWYNGAYELDFSTTLKKKE